MVLVVIALAAILAMAALALDGGHMLVNKTRLQNAVDAAALSGAKTLQPLSGNGNASTLTRDAALDTLTRDANAPGNEELATAIAAAGGVGNFAVVELSHSVYGDFNYPYAGLEEPRYVRVSVPNYELSEFFWGILRHPLISGDDEDAPDKAVAAIATAGPSPSQAPCKLEPIMVCGDPNQYDPESGNFWGYGLGDLIVLKSAAGNDPDIGPGNFQLLRLDGASGANDLRTALAGGIDQCNVVGEEAPTEPGNTVGPVAQGLNTRLGIYNGPGMDSTSYPPDWVTDYNNPTMTYDGSTDKVQLNGEDVISDPLDPGTLTTASGAEIYDLNDWEEDSHACAASPGSCNGEYERRMLNLVMGDCDGVSGGQVDVPVLGFGCFYMLQPVNQQGSEAQVFGQFDRECEGDGYAGPTPEDDLGPIIIQLYKTYIDNSQTPSTDS